MSKGGKDFVTVAVDKCVVNDWFGCARPSFDKGQNELVRYQCGFREKVMSRMNTDCFFYSLFYGRPYPKE